MRSLTSKFYLFKNYFVRYYDKIKINLITIIIYYSKNFKTIRVFYLKNERLGKEIVNNRIVDYGLRF